MKFATKTCYYPPHLRHVATQPWEIKKSNFLNIVSKYGSKCRQIAFLIACNFASYSPYWLQIKFFTLLLFYIFSFAINLWHRKFVTADVTAVFVNSQHGVQRRGQDFENNFICNLCGERLAIWNTGNIKICGWITKLEAIKMHFFAFLPYLLNICRNLNF